VADRATRTERSARRSYGHFCGLARALDQVGDRWAVLVIRELLAGPRRYTDLHTDLPGVSTDMLAARLRDLEADGIVERRAPAVRGAASLYALTERGHDLLPAVTALAAWGAADLDERRSTDAVRASWHALPLRAVLREAGMTGVVDVVCDDGSFHVRLDDGCAAAEAVYGDGPADPPAERTLTLDTPTLVDLCRRRTTLSTALETATVGSAVRDGR
jgi:DNA-binding HxlR family transcriptional regulator